MGDGPCDYGSSPSELASLFPHHDFSAISENWWPVDETDDEVRSTEQPGMLRHRPNRSLGTPSYSGFTEPGLGGTAFSSSFKCYCF